MKERFEKKIFTSKQKKKDILGFSLSRSLFSFVNHKVFLTTFCQRKEIWIEKAQKISMISFSKEAT